MEPRNLPDKELKTMVIRCLTNLEDYKNSSENLNKEIENIKKRTNQNWRINEMKNTLQRTNRRLDDAKEQVSGNKVVEIKQL